MFLLIVIETVLLVPLQTNKRFLPKDGNKGWSESKEEKRQIKREKERKKGIREHRN
jgi:hypothetical protein